MAKKRRTRFAYEQRGIDMSGGAYENMTKEQLAALAAHEAKMANQRMRRLEAAGFGSGSTLSPAYHIMQTDISRWFPGAQKFSEHAGVYQKMRISTIKAILRDLEYNKSLKTSTVKGVKQTMKRRRKGFEDKTGVKFKTDEQFRRFWADRVGKSIFEILGSGEAINMINTSKKGVDAIIKDARAWLLKDNGDKDNADKIAQILGFENVADARDKVKQAKEEEAKKKAAEAAALEEKEQKKAAKPAKPAKVKAKPKKSTGVGRASLERAAQIVRKGGKRGTRTGK